MIKFTITKELLVKMDAPTDMVGTFVTNYGDNAEVGVPYGIDGAMEFLNGPLGRWIGFLYWKSGGESKYQFGLSGADLSGYDLSGYDLRGVIFDHADLSGADLDDAILNGASFRETKCEGIHINAATLIRAINMEGLRYEELSEEAQSYAREIVWQLYGPDWSDIMDCEIGNFAESVKEWIGMEVSTDDVEWDVEGHEVSVEGWFMALYALRMMEDRKSPFGGNEDWSKRAREITAKYEEIVSLIQGNGDVSFDVSLKGSRSVRRMEYDAGWMETIERIITESQYGILDELVNSWMEIAIRKGEFSNAYEIVRQSMSDDATDWEVAKRVLDIGSQHQYWYHMSKLGDDGYPRSVAQTGAEMLAHHYPDVKKVLDGRGESESAALLEEAFRFKQAKKDYTSEAETQVDFIADKEVERLTPAIESLGEGLFSLYVDLVDVLRGWMIEDSNFYDSERFYEESANDYELTFRPDGRELVYKGG